MEDKGKVNEAVCLADERKPCCTKCCKVHDFHTTPSGTTKEQIQCPKIDSKQTSDHKQIGGGDVVGKDDVVKINKGEAVKNMVRATEDHREEKNGE